MIADCQKALRDQPILEELVRAYSDKGIKLLKIQQLTDEFTNKLNEFAPLLYGEAVTFRIQVETNKFAILVKRPRKVISDVRMLSGSESQRFNLLAMLAVYSMVPSSHRTNFIVLDEMVANADPVTLMDFTKDFVPRLHELIPNIFVISPNLIQIPNSSTLTAVKRGSETRLKTASLELTNV